MHEGKIIHVPFISETPIKIVQMAEKRMPQHRKFSLQQELLIQFYTASGRLFSFHP